MKSNVTMLEIWNKVLRENIDKESQRNPSKASKSIKEGKERNFRIEENIPRENPTRTPSLSCGMINSMKFLSRDYHPETLNLLASNKMHRNPFVVI